MLASAGADIKRSTSPAATSDSRASRSRKNSKPSRNATSTGKLIWTSSLAPSSATSAPLQRIAKRPEHRLSAKELVMLTLNHHIRLKHQPLLFQRFFRQRRGPRIRTSFGIGQLPEPRGGAWFPGHNHDVDPCRRSGRGEERRRVPRSPSSRARQTI
jgi:hypothetical protein